VNRRQGRIAGQDHPRTLLLADELGQQALYLDLELPSDRAKLTDAELYLSQHAERLVILDEIHRLAEPAILIISFNYANAMRDDLKSIAWDMVVVDEAHKLRNAYVC
jgi:predicted AAA+ superfamily ATPase